MKYRLIKATILLLILWPAALPAAMDFIFEESLAQSLARMESLYSGGKWDEAMHIGRGILKDAPKDHPAARRAHDVIILAIDGRNKELIANENRGKAKQKQENSQQLVTEGAKLLNEKNYAAAAEKLSQAVKLYAGDAQTFFLLGYAQLQAEKRKEAYQSLKQCLKLNPDHSRALFHIAGLSYEFNHGAEAENYAATLIAAIEKKLEELKDAFIDQRSKGLNDNAVTTTRKMAALNNNLAQASFMHGVLTQKRKDYKIALKSFERAARLNPASADNWFHLGSCFLQLKVYHQASLALEQSVLIRETILKDLSSNAGRLLDAGKSDEAVEAELQTRKIKEEIAKGLYLLAIAHGKKKETANAIRNIDRALELKPDFVQGRYARAILLAEDNNFEEALEQMRMVLKDSTPNSSQAKKAIKTITFLMDLIARRDNPTEVAAAQPKKQMVDVDQYVKDMPGIGGKEAEVRLEDVFPRLREINRLVSMRNHAEAVRRLLYLRTQHPDIADIHAILGHCYMEMGRIDDAATCFDQAILLQPDHSEALNNMAYILATKVEKLDVALDYINRALARDSLRAEFHHTHGWVMFKTGEIKKASESFARAIELKPNYLLARYNLGLANYIGKNFPAAIEAFEGVLAINPHHHKALLFKAIGLARTNNAEDALKTLENLRSKLTEKSVLARVVGDLHARIKLAHERLTDLPVPELKSPAPIERLMAEAMAFRSKGLVTRAKEKYLECQRLAPDRYEPWFALGEMYAEAGLNTPALSAWERAEKLNPEDFSLQMNLGKMHHKLGKPDKARQFFTRAQALREKDAEPRYYLGLLAYEAKSFESAESYALSALRLKPDYYKSMALLGMARVRLNRLRPARDIYETLYAKAPADSSIKRHARKKIWELTRMMAPAQYPSVEDAMEVKNQIVKKVAGNPEQSGYKPAPGEENAFAEYGKNTMTIEDKAWVLKQLKNSARWQLHRRQRHCEK
jgi:tetratricopeptide (TPR) repeat protein